MAPFAAAGLLADEGGRLNPLVPHPMEILFAAPVEILSWSRC